MNVKMMSDLAIVPTRADDGSVGYDLYSTEDCLIYPESAKKIGIGIALEIPEGYAGIISHRSGMHSNNRVAVYGVVDFSYRGEIMVTINNLSFGGAVLIKRGDRIAQMVLHKVSTPLINIVDSLSSTVRGEGGHGSTGV